MTLQGFGLNVLFRKGLAPLVCATSQVWFSPGAGSISYLGFAMTPRTI